MYFHKSSDFNIPDDWEQITYFELKDLLRSYLAGDPIEKDKEIFLQHYINSLQSYTEKYKRILNAEEISKIIGNSLPRLRKLSQVKKSGYYLDHDFLTGLKLVSEEEDWDISYSKDGKLIVKEDNIDSVLLVLNNGRLTSKINEESFDVDVKHKYAPDRVN